MHKTKFIIVTGGVLSALGKGIAAASIGRLLNSKLKVVSIKNEGYLNVQPGTMNPIEHGEVFVLDDGEEADMDFGHYERFLDTNCKAHWNITMGKVFYDVIEKERRGDYLGKTVQFIPHVTDCIKEKWFKIAEEENADIAILEIGGTVGDIETELHIEAARQLRQELGKEDVIFVHVTYVPKPYGANEQKSKPTQQSVKLLNEKGINPDIIIGRCSEKITDNVKKKISLFCNIDERDVFSGIDVKSVYEIPLIFEKEGMVESLHKKLNIYSPPDLLKWKELVNNLLNAMNKKEGINVAICGKYTNLEDSYASINEALKHCSAHLKTKVNIKWIETTLIEEGKLNIKDALKDIDGVIIPGGFGSRGVEGKIKVIEYIRKNNIPFLGICYGMQLAIVEFARNVCGLKDAHTVEVNPKTKYPVIAYLEGQENIEKMGGTLRLGSYYAYLKEKTKTYSLYGDTIVSERHRHRLEVNPKYHNILKKNGMIFSGMSKDNLLVEFIELPKHKFFCATQSHPELKSRLEKPAPLFYGFVKACLE